MQKHSDEVCILLGVWGEKFIHYFLDLSLASLLAPGNLPALSQQYRTRFIFLTRSQDTAVFENHPDYERLKKLCTIEFIAINDLIVIGNYSTSLTLAYDRAVKAQGAAMLKTYFIFLTSDYIFADGAFQGLMRYMQKGYSGIQAGNFQVSQEDMEPYLLSKIDSKSHVLAIKPRELLVQSLKHLHPITVASFIDQNMAHNHLANRFFYLKENAMAGRFYLLHMLCIKPETMDYQVGASCDYSFIPEMCPSGNIATITDSDDYFVIEIQSNNHELENISTGPYTSITMSKALAEWTTSHHRQNATQTIFYHSDDLSADKRQVLEQGLTDFLNSINKRLENYRPKPFRNHPYWLGAYSTLEMYQKKMRGRNELNYYDIYSLYTHSHFKKLFFKYFGTPPDVYRWHYRWREYASVSSQLNKFIDIHQTKTLAIFQGHFYAFLRYSEWLYKNYNITHNYHYSDFLKSQKTNTSLQSPYFERCILSLTVEDLHNIPSMLEKINMSLANNGEILVFIPNDKNTLLNSMYDIQRMVFFRMNHFINSKFTITDIIPIYDNFSFLGTFAIDNIKRRYNYSKKRRLFSFMLLGIPGATLSLIRNLFSKRKNTNKSGHCTNILIKLSRQELKQDFA